jgi:hypothetical protein
MNDLQMHECHMISGCGVMGNGMSGPMLLPAQERVILQRFKWVTGSEPTIPNTPSGTHCDCELSSTRKEFAALRPKS